ncbi:MAG: MBL fold metallo-hydrolase [Acidobacteria bacterium]|nr:MBL fold metallo-hydrolase [Acidobacteriota bacterium]
MTAITFYGATGTVTGSRHLLDIGGKQILIDCGLFQGPKENRLKNWEKFPVPAGMIDSVFLTHAHLDHSGYLPKLQREGFKGKIYATHATGELCEILLKDSAHIQEEDAKWANKKKFTRHSPALPLYTTADAEGALSRFHTVHYGDEIRLDDITRVKFRDAGHILGSSFVDIKRGHNDEARKILFSGDLGRPDRPVLRDPTQIYNVDYLILESTYGDRRHGPNPSDDDLVRVVTESIDRGGILVVPAFAVGRTQTFLYTLRRLEEEGRIPVLPVYVDSPMGIATTEVFGQHIPDLNLKNRRLALEHKELFQPKNLRVCRTREESKSINNEKGPGIIVSSSGMATGGRILHHLEHRLPNSRNTVLFIGYQARGTRGRTILEGKPTVKIHGRQVPVQAAIETITGYSGHADYEEILAWLMGFNRPPERVFIVHGEPEASRSLAEKIRKQFHWKVTIPEFGQRFDLNF